MLYDVMLCGCPMCSVKRGRMMRFDIIIISERRKETNTSIDLDLDATTTKEKLTQILVVPSGTRGRERGTDIGKIFERKPLILFMFVCFAYL